MHTPSHSSPTLRFESQTHAATNPSERQISAVEPDCVTVSVADVLPLMVEAALTNRAWIEDFADESLQIPQDMYEVLLAYHRYRAAA